MMIPMAVAAAVAVVAAAPPLPAAAAAGKEAAVERPAEAAVHDRAMRSSVYLEHHQRLTMPHQRSLAAPCVHVPVLVSLPLQ